MSVCSSIRLVVSISAALARTTKVESMDSCISLLIEVLSQSICGTEWKSSILGHG